MACNPELVSAFLDGELETVILHPVVAHLLKCDHCCQTMGWLAQVKDGIGGYLWQDGEDMTQSIMGAIRNEKVYSVHAGLFDRLRRFGVPAVMIATALSALPNGEGVEPAVEQVEISFISHVAGLSGGEE
ncbi:zf-HC2 domain-containing protein [Candidatus Magnetaquicoccus inordinatus]|uniref:zf-HC2 domain-containing protein n=1 Tax=Candidatus Magnetaquicoccus inordinatus TaxID=2496818 RepID=UPI00102BE8C0|nr:zf-HC2 domain-containing protein [Candidatus Magnetaquicoccus inordinatus]